MEIAKLHKLLRATIVYVTHDQVEAMTLADRIVVMSAGRIEQVGKPLDLYYQPANLFVAGFIGSPAMNFFPARVQGVAGGEARIVGDAFADLRVSSRALKAGDEVTVGVRPEHLQVSAGGPFVTSGAIELVERLGEGVLRLRAPRRREAPRRRNARPRHAQRRRDRHLQRLAQRCPPVRPRGPQGFLGARRPSVAAGSHPELVEG